MVPRADVGEVQAAGGACQQPRAQLALEPYHAVARAALGAAQARGRCGEAAAVGHAGNGQHAAAGTLVRTRADGDTLAFAAPGGNARFTLFSGTPLAQPRAMQGSFVARDTEQAQRFVREHASGRSGMVMPFGRA